MPNKTLLTKMNKKRRHIIRTTLKSNCSLSRRTAEEDQDRSKGAAREWQQGELLQEASAQTGTTKREDPSQEGLQAAQPAPTPKGIGESAQEQTFSG